MTTTDDVGPPGGDDLAAVERAISALEAQRSVLGDDVVETALLPLRERRTVLLNRTEGEQRKLVTVVFADLVGFTDLSAWLDPEDTRSIVDAYFGRWRRAIEDQGGVVEKFIGDAVMAVFGLHRSWEDDAQRAVRAALAMVADLADLNEELTRRFHVSLRMRVGIDTGDVVVSTLGERGDESFVAVGPTVNRAARIQAAAPPDRILISGDTHRQVRARFSMERVEPLHLKGIEEAVDAFLVVSERPPGYHLDRSSGVEGVETTTVGRDAELRYLQERMWDVAEESRWRVVTVVGEAGVGKSRLLIDFDQWLAEWSETVYWFRGRASHSGQNHANALLRDVVGSRFGIHESDDAPQVRAKMETGFARAYDDESAAHRAAHLVGAWLGFDLGETPTVLPSDPQAVRAVGTEALAEYFRQLSRHWPVVLLLEDLHWADDGSLRWLDAADTVLQDARVLVVATARPSLLEDRPRWAEGLSHHVRLPLNPLSRRQSRMLLLQILQHLEDPPPALMDLVIESADGNPFYIEELVTWLIDARVIVKGDPDWHVEDELVDSVVVPSTLRGVLQARLDALTRPERAVLQRASVVGRVFWDEAVLRLATAPGAAGNGDTAQTLDGLRRRELVFEREVSAFDAAREFLFKHALLRDVAYDGVLRAHRERYHRLAGVWLAEVSARSGREDEYAALVAEHFDRAHDPAAAEWYFRAGRQAVAVFALDEGTRLLGRALALLVDEPRLRFDVLAVRETVLDRLGDRDAQLLDLMEMEALAGRLGDQTRLVRLQLARSRLAFAISEYDDAEEWAGSAIATAEAAGLRGESAEAHLWRGKSQTWRDDVDDARTSLRHALDVGREAGRASVEGEALRYLSMLANNEGAYADALDLGSRAREVFRRAGDLESEGTATAQQATTCYNLGRMDEARSLLEQVLPLFRRSGHRYREAIVLGNLATIVLAQGELAQARSWADAALTVTRGLNDREAVINDLMLLGSISTAAGRWEEARTQLEEALDLARDMEARTGEVEALTRLSFLRLEQEDAVGALSLAREAVSVGEFALSAMERGRAELAQGYAELAAGPVADADASFEAACESFRSLDLPAVVREAWVGRAAAALARDDLPGAVHVVDEVLPHLDRAGLEGTERPEQVLATCWRVLEAAGRPEAGQALAAAKAYVEETAAVIGDEEMVAGYRGRPVIAGLLRVRPSET